MPMTEEMEKVAAEPCHCVSCGECDGNGRIWLDFSGRYLGNHRRDDLDQMDSCDSCGGSGIVETCSRCELLDELEH